MNNRKIGKSSQVFYIALSHYMHDVFSAFLTPVLPLLVNRLGLSLTSVGVLQIVQRAPSLFMPFIGILAERVALRYFVIWSPAITAITMSLLGVAPNFFVLTVLLLIMGFSSALYHVPAPVMLRQITKDRIGLATSLFMLAGELARTTGPIIILSAISLLSFENTFVLMIIGITSSVFLHSALKNIMVSAKIERPPSSGELKKVMRKTSKLLLVIFLILIFRAFVKTSISTYLTLYLTHNGSSLWVAGIMLTILQAAGAVGTFLSGTLSDFVGSKKIIIITTVLVPFFMWGFVSSSGMLQVVYLILIGFVIFASGPVLLALVLKISDKYHSFINGLYMTINFASGSVAALLIGISSDKVGINDTFMYAAFLSIIAIPFTFILYAMKKKIEI